MWESIFFACVNNELYIFIETQRRLCVYVRIWNRVEVMQV